MPAIINTKMITSMAMVRYTTHLTALMAAMKKLKSPILLRLATFSGTKQFSASTVPNILRSSLINNNASTPQNGEYDHCRKVMFLHSLQIFSYVFETKQADLSSPDPLSNIISNMEREFDLIEKKYNKLIEQKTVFAKRALARIHYILQEGSSDEDHIVKLINLLDHHANSPQVLEQMRDRIRVGTQFKNITDRSFYNRKNAEDAGFHPIAMEKHNEETQMTDFVPKPLYTKKQLQEFRQKNIVDGRFVSGVSSLCFSIAIG